MAIRLIPHDAPDLGPAGSWDDDRPRVLGRAADCDLVIAGRGVSKHHASIEKREGTWFVTDLGSSNGTFLNHRRIHARAPLGHGDELTLGLRTFAIRFEESTEADTGIYRVHEASGERSLAGPRLLIGRRADCHLVVTDPGISRRQCEIVYHDEGFVLRDLISRNGTFVNAERVVSRHLASGDHIFFGNPEQAASRTQIAVSIEDGACLLHVERAAESALGTGSFELRTGAALAAELDPSQPRATLTPPPPESQPPEAPPAASASGVRRAAPSEVAPVSAAARREDSIRESSELSRVIPTLARHKAKYRGGKWVPTSDLLPHHGRRIGNAAVLVATLLAGATLLGSGRIRPEAGALAAVHQGEKFLAEQRGEKTACRPCHVPWRGVTNQACSRCHPGATIASPHDPPMLAAAGHEPLRCAGCHLEHQGYQGPARASTDALAATPHPPPALPVDRSACLRCHAQAHSRPPPPAPGAPGTPFLNVAFSSTWVHTLHLTRPACASCHQDAEAQASGRVTTPCQACHGGSLGAAANGLCLTCHYLHRSGPLLPKRSDGG